MIDEQGEDQQHVCGEKAEPFERGDRGSCERHDKAGMFSVAPRQRGENPALFCAQYQHQTEENGQDRDDLGQKSGARQRQVARRQVATQGDHQQPEADKETACDVVRAQNH